MHERHWQRISEEQHKELVRWRSIGRALVECDPADMAADGVTCLDVWRKEATEILANEN